MRRKLIFALGFLNAMAIAADQPATLSINGSAVLKKPAERINLMVSVISEAENAEVALQSNRQKMKSIIAALQAKEISGKEFSTGQFNISPTYTPYPKDPPPHWISKINGYRVTNSLDIQTDKLDLAGQIIDAVSEAGASSIDHISFGLKDLRLYRQEAIKTATQHAMQDAEDLALAANLKLGRIQQIWLDQAKAPEPTSKIFAVAMDRSTPIEAGDVTINANVTIVYQVHADN